VSARARAPYIYIYICIRLCIRICIYIFLSYPEQKLVAQRLVAFGAGKFLKFITGYLTFFSRCSKGRNCSSSECAGDEYGYEVELPSGFKKPDFYVSY
jgi:hypothetical protein